MKKLLLFLGSPMLFVLPVFAEDMAVEDWYRNSYAVLWEANPWDKVDEAADHYDAELHLHSPQESHTAVDSKAWVADAIAGWKADGWLGSDLAELQIDQLHASTVVFKSKWRDRYADDVEEFSCAWYLADRKDGHWLFTEYAEIDCAEHDL